MGNPFAGEVTITLDGVPHLAKLTLGALAELEAALESGSLVDLISRFEAQHVTETSKEYPVSINGKVRANIAIALDATEAQVQEIVLNNELIQKWIEEKPIKKLIFVKGKMVNVVI